MTAAEPELGSERPLPPQRLVQRDRMKAAQDVATSLARELRNPVFAIASAAQLLRYRVVDDKRVTVVEPMQPAIEKIRRKWAPS